MSTINENEEFHQRLLHAAEVIVEADKGRIGSSAKPELLKWDYESRTVTFRYEFLPWMLNCNDVMHGGIICLLMDSSMGWLSCGYSKDFHVTPSVSMHVTYLEPVFKRDHICVTAHLNAVKGKILYAEAKMFYEDSPEIPLASTVGEYYRMSSSVKLHKE